MIPNNKGWHYLSEKKHSALLRGKTSKHHDDFDCLNCRPSLRTKKQTPK